MRSTAGRFQVGHGRTVGRSLGRILKSWYESLTNLELREHHKLKQYNSVAWERLGAEVLALGK